ncbi:Predicted membrane protein [Yoonia tamlensis]|uniref:Predicted membrane protein n=1 Tax=Yoonia tamlensis TaxID=390270 RepID=A0A1I6FXJ1_9RHOB|nr:DUF2306 domain-containing protein [Yoonia tamlensis]SFR34636.1 Predicted membrane protein [Yoonia tamlensis]
MERRSVNPISVAAALLFLSSIPIMMALVRVVQIPLGQTPADTAHLMQMPLHYWGHAAAGATFALLGPLQFGRVLARKFGWLHKFTGRIFVLAGAVMALTGLGLIAGLPQTSSLLIDSMRIAGGATLLVMLAVSLAAIRKRNLPRHRDWMIRAYAVGVGQSLVSFILFPVYLITGEPPAGVIADLVFAVSWVVTIGVAELIIARLHRRPATPLATS